MNNATVKGGLKTTAKGGLNATFEGGLFGVTQLKTLQKGRFNPF